MATISKINDITISAQPSYADAISTSTYDSNAVQLKTIDFLTAQTKSKQSLLDYYEKLRGFLLGSVSSNDYAVALNTIKNYVLTADDYTKLRDGEITVKDFLKNILQDELYSTTAQKEGYYIKLGAALQTVINSINTNVIDPINTNFASSTLFPNGIITADYFSPEVKKDFEDFSAGSTVITSQSTTVINTDTSESTLSSAAVAATADYTEKPSVIIISA